MLIMQGLHSLKNDGFRTKKKPTEAELLNKLENSDWELDCNDRDANFGWPRTELQSDSDESRQDNSILKGNDEQTSKTTKTIKWQVDSGNMRVMDFVGTERLKILPLKNIPIVFFRN